MQRQNNVTKEGEKASKHTEIERESESHAKKINWNEKSMQTV